MAEPRDGTTTSRGVEPWLADARRLAPPREAAALVIAWCAAEPHRAGEVALLDDGGPPQLLGRGGARQDDVSPRAAFVRQRPWGSDACPPLAGSGISRQQLLLTAHEGGVAFRRLGRAVILANGRPADRGLVRAGDTLAIENQLLLACARRPSPLPRPRHVRPEQAPAFGEPDADGIVGESAAVWALRDEIAFAASVPGHVLILGESGTGKELVARAVHRLSTRGQRPLLARSAVSFPDTLIDAELFGNMRDYPNPGMPLRPGLLGAADGTSVLLDEIGELPASLQAHLLRVLDAGGQYHRLGESGGRRSDFRLIAATNRPLSALKEDFAARFTLRVHVPSLAERREDIPLIARRLLTLMEAQSPALCQRFAGVATDGGRFHRFDPSFVDMLLRHPYTLNVRELDAMLWAAVRGSRGGVLEAPGPSRAAAAPAAPPSAPAPRSPPTPEEVQAALARHGGNQSKAYRDLGLSSRYTLRRLLRKGADRVGGEKKR
jgi:two-component system nitrogen regulation response regulator GlnG/two-component system response regulator HydG